MHNDNKKKELNLTISFKINLSTKLLKKNKNMQIQNNVKTEICIKL